MLRDTVQEIFTNLPKAGNFHFSRSPLLRTRVNFKKLTSDIDPRIVCPSKYHLSTKLIPETSANNQRKLQQLMETTLDIFVTVDLWSTRHMRSVTGITTHFISDWKLLSAVLACRRFTGLHTADNISVQYEDVVNEFNIAGKVTHVVSDNASNMVKPFKLPGYNANNHSDSNDTPCQH